MKKQQKKIIHFITKSNFGGAQKYVYEMAKASKENDFEILVVFGGKGILYEKLKEGGVPVKILESLNRNINPLRDIISLCDIFKIIKKEKPDIIHLNSSKIGFLGGLVGRTLKVKKIIFTAHGWAFNENRGFLSKNIFKIIQWKTVILSHKTIAVSKKTADDILNMPLVKNRIVVIKNGIDINPGYDKEIARNKLKKHIKNLNEINPEAIWLGTISELHENKGLDYALETLNLIIKKNENIIFIIIGEGEKRNDLEKIILKNNLKKNVFLVGFIPEASKLLKAFDIFLLSSITEALPYVVLEAGVNERPVVATKVGGIPEIIEDMKSGIIVKPKDPKDIFQAINYMIENPEYSKKLGKNLNEKVKKEYSIKKQIEETLKLYRE